MCKKLLKPNKASVLHVVDKGAGPAGCSLLIGNCSGSNPTDKCQEDKYFLHDSWYKNTPLTALQRRCCEHLQAMEAEMQGKLLIILVS